MAYKKRPSYYRFYKTSLDKLKETVSNIYTRKDIISTYQIV